MLDEGKGGEENKREERQEQVILVSGKSNKHLLRVEYNERDAKDEKRTFRADANIRVQSKRFLSNQRNPGSKLELSL